MSENNNASSGLLFFLAGMGIGAILAVLFAPLVGVVRFVLVTDFVVVGPLAVLEISQAPKISLVATIYCSGREKRRALPMFGHT